MLFILQGCRANIVFNNKKFCSFIDTKQVYIFMILYSWNFNWGAGSRSNRHQLRRYHRQGTVNFTKKYLNIWVSYLGWHLHHSVFRIPVSVTCQDPILRRLWLRAGLWLPAGLWLRAGLWLQAGLGQGSMSASCQFSLVCTEQGPGYCRACAHTGALDNALFWGQDSRNCSSLGKRYWYSLAWTQVCRQERDQFSAATKVTECIKSFFWVRQGPRWWLALNFDSSINLWRLSYNKYLKLNPLDNGIIWHRRYVVPTYYDQPTRDWNAKQVSFLPSPHCFSWSWRPYKGWLWHTCQGSAWEGLGLSPCLRQGAFSCTNHTAPQAQA